mgnify:CR=1 FL=1
MDNQGWITLHRSLLEWEWYDDVNTKCLWIHLLLKANHQKNVWHGVEVQRGEVITGRIELAKELDISEQSIRTSLTKLKSTNNITIKTTNKFSVISIQSYDDYQQINQQIPNNQPTTNQQLTTNKNDKNDKELLDSEIEDISKTNRVSKQVVLDYQANYLLWKENNPRKPNKLRPSVKMWIKRDVESGKLEQRKSILEKLEAMGIPIVTGGEE